MFVVRKQVYVTSIFQLNAVTVNIKTYNTALGTGYKPCVLELSINY
jgi:hypothetical protein